MEEVKMDSTHHEGSKETMGAYAPMSDDEQDQSLGEEYLKLTTDVQTCEEGDLSKPKCRGVKISESLLRAVDNLVVEEFERGTKSLWRLNSLVDAGAVLVSNRVRKPWKTPMLQGETHKEEDVLRLRRKIRVRSDS